MPFLKHVTFHIAALAFFASCSPIVDNRGHSADDADYSQIIPGQSRPEDVRAILGSPSSESNFGEKTWYYISERKETVGMHAPKVLDTKVTAIRFDENDRVVDMAEIDKDKGRDVTFVEMTTPTEGRKMSAMEQLLGNFGKFNAPGRAIDPRNLGR